jgi:hypothetical protein
VTSMRTLLAAALATACCTQGRPPPPDDRAGPAARAAAPLPLASGLLTVRGGETIELRGASVTVSQVTYLDQPCPPNVQCIHSGVIRQVLLRVVRSGPPVLASLGEGERQVVDGVELAVKAVRAGPEADLEASLPVAAGR